MSPRRQASPLPTAPDGLVEPVLEAVGDALVEARGRLVLAREVRERRRGGRPTPGSSPSGGASSRSTRALAPLDAAQLGVRRAFVPPTRRVAGRAAAAAARRGVSVRGAGVADGQEWTLWERDLMLAVRQRQGHVRGGQARQPGLSRRADCVEPSTGAAPGGWTWALARLGADVVAVDKADMDPAVAALDNVEVRTESAFVAGTQRRRPGRLALQRRDPQAAARVRRAMARGWDGPTVRLHDQVPRRRRARRGAGFAAINAQAWCICTTTSTS